MHLAALLTWALNAEAAPPPPPDAAECVGVWEASVVEVGTGEPLPGVRVELSRAGVRGVLTARTDPEGQVRIEALCPGDVRITVNDEEHAEARLKVTLDGAEMATTIELDPLHARHGPLVRQVVIGGHGGHQTGSSASESLAGDALARTRGKSLADTLSEMAGVSTLRGSAGGMGKPMIRGHQGRRTMILVDGIRHEGQDWGIDHAPEVDPQAADRLTVIKGAGTTRFGAKALGGVVMLQSRPLPQRPSVRSEVSTFGGSNPLGGGGAARVEIAPPRARGFAMRVEGNVNRHRAIVTPTYALDNTGSLTWNAGTLLGYSSDAFDLGVGYRLMRSKGGICACLRISTPDEFQQSIARGRPVDADSYRADFAIERARQEIWHHLAYLNTRVRLGRIGELHGIYSFQYNDREEYGIVRETVAGPQLTFGLATHAVDLRLEHARLEVGRWSQFGTLGANFSHQSNDFEAASTLIPDYKHNSWALYNVERLTRDRVELEVGVRYEGMVRDTTLSERDYLGQVASGRLDAEACAAQGSGGACQHPFHAVSGTVGALLWPSLRLPEMTWRSQLHSSARIPSIDEQFMNGAAPSFPILGVGSSTIGIERSWGGESTLAFDGDWLFLEAAGYASFIDDYIYFVPQPQEGQCAPLSCTTRGPLPVFAFTPTDALFGGGELRFDVKAPRLPLSMAGSASWVRGQNLVDREPLALVPADRYVATGRYHFPESRVSSRAYLELGGTLVARQRRAPLDIEFAPPPPLYFLLGAGAGAEFATERRVVRLSVVGNNLLNQRYRDYTSLLRYFADEAGWSVQLRLSIDLDVELGENSGEVAQRRRRGRPGTRQRG